MAANDDKKHNSADAIDLEQVFVIEDRDEVEKDDHHQGLIDLDVGGKDRTSFLRHPLEWQIQTLIVHPAFQEVLKGVPENTQRVLIESALIGDIAFDSNLPQYKAKAKMGMVVIKKHRKTLRALFDKHWPEENVIMGDASYGLAKEADRLFPPLIWAREQRWMMYQKGRWVQVTEVYVKNRLRKLADGLIFEKPSLTTAPGLSPMSAAALNTCSISSTLNTR
ncbi:hypothetical protein [Ruegeria sp. HKCCA5763]|uniref:hypothetical protein n=1 Tax=Ruegeria sp. HKCCA5763 TaxID=2682987 RepID=UPI001489F30D|nr:hypothetical protein [Ruegeria sp. HKCCA5763]